MAQSDEAAQYEKECIQDIQQMLNVIHGGIERVDDETKWAAPELMLSISCIIITMAKGKTKPKTKTVTRTVAVPKTKIVKQEPQQKSKPKHTKSADFKPIRSQPPLSNQ